MGFVAFSALLLTAVDALAVNVLFSDQWGLYFRVDGAPLHEAFLAQHGAHRYGLGGVATALIARASDWDARAEAFFVAGVLIGTAGLALALKVRLTGRVSVLDVFIPALVLSLAQHEVVTMAPAPAQAAIPLFLLLAFVLGLTVRDPRVRYPLLVGTSGLATFTGFGLVLGLLAPVALLASIRTRPAESGAALGATTFVVGAGVVFLIGYRVSSGADCSGISSAVDWVHYLLTLHARPLGLRYEMPLVWPVGAVLVGHTLAMAWRSAIGHPDQARVALPLATLGLSAFLFAALTAIGRLCLGPELSNSSRYVTLMLPAALALYVSLWLIPAPRFRRLGLAAGTSLLLLGALGASFIGIEGGRRVTVLKQVWVECYLRAGDVAYCDDWTDFTLNPSSTGERPPIHELAPRGLSLFRDAAAIAANPPLVPPDFDRDAYSRAHPEAQAAGRHPMYHYVAKERGLAPLGFVPVL